MPAAKTTWYAPLTWCWFVLGAVVALAVHAAEANDGVRAMGSLQFDYPLRLVEIVYAAKGLTPYTDFGFVYPPGHVWFYGKLLGLQNPESMNATIVWCSFLLWSICTWQVMRLTAAWRWLLGGTILLAIGGAMPLIGAVGSSSLLEPLPLLLIAVLLIVEVMERGPSAVRLTALACVALVGTLFRWDWILFVVILQAGWAAVMRLVARALKPDQSIPVKHRAGRLGWAALSAGAGVALAVAVIAGHAIATGTWADTRLFMFYVPVSILPFRRLPLPMGVHTSTPWLTAVIGMALIALAASLDYIKTRSQLGLVSLLKGGALLVPCVALLPYAFGRADETHFAPLTMTVIVMAMAAFTSRPCQVARWLLLLALVLNVEPVVHWAIRLVSDSNAQQAGIHIKQAPKLTSGCTKIFPSDARSLFVGQVSYGRFLINTPMFYLLRPDLRPATPFISDEPGVQNSCTLGSRIAADLNQAPRPLVLVLDTTPYSPEPNGTQTMSSCGKIEAAIAAMPAVLLGTCQVTDDYTSEDTRSFQVMAVR